MKSSDFFHHMAVVLPEPQKSVIHFEANKVEQLERQILNAEIVINQLEVEVKGTGRSCSHRFIDPAFMGRFVEIYRTLHPKR